MMIGGWFFFCLGPGTEIEFGAFSSFENLYNRYSDAELILADIPIIFSAFGTKKKYYGGGKR